LNGDQIATRHKSQAGASDFVKSKAKPGPSVVIKAGIKEVSNH
jgi:hypothetical protein